jgi:uncharacterized protein (TIGR00730 family)
MKVSVFGGSSPKEGSSAYQQAYKLGKLLGGAGMTVLTGGYMGTMEATSKGASEAGGHVIGVTSGAIEAYRPTKPNQWVDEEWRFEGFRERVNTLVEKCDAAFALPGGVGTMLEICMTWNQLVINSIPPKPLILIGDSWHNVMNTFFQELGDYIPAHSRELITYADDSKTGFDLLLKYNNEQKENKNEG